MNADKFIKTAEGEIGVKEDGENRVKYNTWYYGSEVEGTAYPWCAVFVSWCARSAKVDTKFLPNAKSVSAMRAFAEDNENYVINNGTSVPAVGDIMLEGAHCGIVTAVGRDGTFVTVEGNVSNAVCRRTRSIHDKNVKGFIHIPFSHSVDNPKNEGATTTLLNAMKVTPVHTPESASGGEGIIFITRGGESFKPLCTKAVWESYAYGASRLSFDMLTTDAPSFSEGDSVTLRVQGSDVFCGTIFTKLTHSDETETVIAYDNLRYLENRVLYASAKTTAAKAVKELCALCGIDADVSDMPSVTIEEFLCRGSVCRDMIAQILRDVKRACGTECILYDDTRRVRVVRTSNLECGVTLHDAERMERSSTIEEDYANTVTLYREEDGVIAQETVEDNSLAKMGTLRRLTHTDCEDMASEAKSLLCELSHPSCRVELYGAKGDGAVRGGVGVTLDTGGEKTPMRVKSARHVFEGGVHLMDTELY